VFSMMDWKQLKPISGLPVMSVMLSPMMITSFTFLDLGHSVRARGIQICSGFKIIHGWIHQITHQR
jgi:hypothetical protein